MTGVRLDFPSAYPHWYTQNPLPVLDQHHPLCLPFFAKRVVGRNSNIYQTYPPLYVQISSAVASCNSSRRSSSTLSSQQRDAVRRSVDHRWSLCSLCRAVCKLLLTHLLQSPYMASVRSRCAQQPWETSILQM